MIYTPTSRNIGLLRKVLAHRTIQAEPDAKGSFKHVQRVQVGSKQYALKWPRLSQSVWAHGAAGNGREDVLREVAVYRNTRGVRRYCVPYLAWGDVDGQFYAVQPWVDVAYDTQETWDEGARIEDITGLDDLHPNNLGTWRGGLRVIDWGWQGPGRKRLQHEAGGFAYFGD